MSVTTLKGTAWYFNSTIVTTDPVDLHINFEIESGNQYVRLKSVSSSYVYYYRTESSSSTVYNSAYLSGWSNDIYRQVYVTGGDDVENATLIAWFEANAVQFAPVLRVKYAEIKKTADAIRGKTGSESSLTWTDGSGFQTAVNNIYLGNDTRQTTAKSSDLKYGKTAYSKETEIIGTMESASGVSF